MKQHTVKVKTVTAIPHGTIKNTQTPTTASNTIATVGKDETVRQALTAVTKELDAVTRMLKENNKKIADLEKYTTQRMDSFEQVSNKRLDAMQLLLDKILTRKDVAPPPARAPVQQVEKEGKDITGDTTSDAESISGDEMDCNRREDTSSSEKTQRRRVTQRRQPQRDYQTEEGLPSDFQTAIGEALKQVVEQVATLTHQMRDIQRQMENKHPTN